MRRLDVIRLVATLWLSLKCPHVVSLALVRFVTDGVTFAKNHHSENGELISIYKAVSHCDAEWGAAFDRK
jgi:hypothetical protein